VLFRSDFEKRLKELLRFQSELFIHLYAIMESLNGKLPSDIFKGIVHDQLDSQITHVIEIAEHIRDTCADLSSTLADLASQSDDMITIAKRFKESQDVRELLEYSNKATNYRKELSHNPGHELVELDEKMEEMSDVLDFISNCADAQG
jgi:transcriptional/translational regulatory protein YebC/TACO1